MIYEEEYNAFEDMDVIEGHKRVSDEEEFIEDLDKVVTKYRFSELYGTFEWTADDEINARIVEATEGMNCLSHTGV